MAPAPPVVLSIAGFDPSSGAGVTADVKTIAAHGCYGVSCITALTVQSTAGVRRVQTVSPALVSETLEELNSDIAIAAVHIGMLGSGKVVQVVVDFLAKTGLPNIVLDPILKSSSGADLIDSGGARLLIRPLDLTEPPQFEEQFTSCDYGEKEPSLTACWSVEAAVPHKMRWLLLPMAAGEDERERLAAVEKLIN